jgi:hypothetical protein
MTYALVVWLNLQVADISFPLLGLPEWSMPLVMMIGLLGFPLVLALAWVFQITPQGIVVDCVDEPNEGSGDRMDLGVNAGLLVFGCALIAMTTVQLTASAEVRAAVGSAAIPNKVSLNVTAAASTAALQPLDTARLTQELRHLVIVTPRMSLVEGADGAEGPTLRLNVVLYNEIGHTRVITTALRSADGAYLYSAAFIVSAVSGAPHVERQTAEKIMAGLHSSLVGDRVGDAATGG